MRQVKPEAKELGSGWYLAWACCDPERAVVIEATIVLRALRLMLSSGAYLLCRLSKDAGCERLLM